jgi:hypothetical protein
VVIWSLFFLNTLTLNRIAVGAKVNFNKDDFMIRDFGVGGDGNPFIAVEGTAGGTKPEIENNGYAYVFATDMGTYAIS